MKVSKKKSSETSVEEKDEAQDPEVLGDAASILSTFGRRDTREQQRNIKTINKAFLEFLSTDPSREEFCGVMDGVNITSLMLWSALKAHH